MILAYHKANKKQTRLLDYSVMGFYDLFMEFLGNFPDYKFEPGPYFIWTPQSRTIGYDPKRLASDHGKLQLLHEVGHALLNHCPDEDRLYQLERDAWDIARLLSRKLGVRSDEGLIARHLKGVKDRGYQP